MYQSKLQIDIKSIKQMSNIEREMFQIMSNNGDTKKIM